MKLALRQGLPKRFTRCLSSFPNVSSVPAAKVTALSNGIRVATEKSQGDTAAVGIWIDAGSRYETAENNGASHFLETLTYSALANDSSMTSQLNTFTSREASVFYTTGAASEVSKVCSKCICIYMPNLTHV
jgi:predicted Zn-dependent peptidase